MAIIRAQVAWGADLPEPRHRVCVTPHFNSTLSGIWDGSQWQSFADDLCTAMAGYSAVARETTVKVYDAEDAPPNYPKATKTLNTGVFPQSNVPRELAICLSYKGGPGPRQRGRLYLPFLIFGMGTMAVRPDTNHRNKAVAFASLMRAAGGADIQWGVWSRVDQEFTPADSAYVDDEWDVVRSRGLPTTNRLTAGTGS